MAEEPTPPPTELPGTPRPETSQEAPAQAGEKDSAAEPAAQPEGGAGSSPQEGPAAVSQEAAAGGLTDGSSPAQTVPAGSSAPAGAGGKQAGEAGRAPKKKESLAATLLSLLIKSVICAVLLWLFVFQISFVKGESMEPSFHEGDRLVIDKLTYWFSDIQRDDVVVFDHVRTPFDAHAADGRPESERHEDYIKRVIGLPGDLVRVQRGIVYVNGHPLTEGYIQHTTQSQLEFYPPPSGLLDEPIEQDSTGMFAVRVQPDCIFVMGDNRGHSTDSRGFGPVKTSLIRGKVRIRMLPLSRFKWFSGGE